MTRAFLLCCSLIGSLSDAPALARDEPKRVDYLRDVRPILSETCYQCHGPDAGKRKGKLRLDLKNDAFRDRGGYAVVAPGKPEESELVARLSAEDDGKMPPEGSGKTLSPAQIDVLRRWVAQGADWKGHWAYEPPSESRAAVVAGKIENDVDRFIRTKLAEHGRDLSPEADRVTLIRRLSFDLTGLPPTPEDVRSFVDDRRDDAYERLVDRLLASPHYGERMAIFWLDLVRYADTTGYHNDNHRDIWMYRDYVIRSFNDNKPFDRFTVEQLAGDLLPDPTTEQRIGSGYNRLLMTTQEGGAQADEYAAKYMADRVRNASSVWLGQTLGCAECHDHKFDPLSTKEFYSFAAFFADVKEIPVGVQEQTPILSPEMASRIAESEARLNHLREILDRQTPELDREQAAWEKSLAEGRIPWTALKPLTATSVSGKPLSIAEDGTISAPAGLSEKETYTIRVKIETGGVTGLRLEVLPDDALPGKGPGRASNGNFVLNEFEVEAAGHPVKVASATASHAQVHWDPAGLIDGKPETGWAILPEVGKVNEAIFELEPPYESDPTAWTILLRQNYGTDHVLGRFRLSATTASPPNLAGGLRILPKPIRDILAIDPSNRSEAQKSDLAKYHRSIAASLSPIQAEFTALGDVLKNVRESAPKTLVTVTAAPREMRILPRGNWLDKTGAVVEPTVPAAIRPAFSSEGRRASRLDLARWLVADENPLVARVIVNRLWKIAFGQGIVSTPDDFGSQGALPTHPELLDWLAVEFRKGGWDVKKTLRMLVLSETYRQTSKADPTLRQADPNNAWLARQDRYRLDAEFVRDDALAISGLLVRKVGGPNARPYQPAGYWSHLNFPKREYQPDHGEGLYRRGLYTYWCRTFLHPSLLAFDAPSREECQVQRPRSNTPLQALVLLNDPTYVEASRVLGERLLRDGETTEGRIRLAFQRALSRDPRPAEMAQLVTIYEGHRDHYRADRLAAKELVHLGEAPVPADLDEAELAAWTSVARVILNLHETITRN